MMYSRESNVTVQRSDFNTRRFGGIGNPCSMNFFEAAPRENISERCSSAGVTFGGNASFSLNSALKLIFPGGAKAVTVFRMVKVRINTGSLARPLAETIYPKFKNASDAFNDRLPWTTPSNVVGVYSAGEAQCHLCEVVVSEGVGLFDPASKSKDICDVKDQCEREDYLPAESLPVLPVVTKTLYNLSSTVLPLQSTHVYHYSAMVGFTCTAGDRCPKQKEMKEVMEALVGLPTEGMGLTVGQPQAWIDVLRSYEGDHAQDLEGLEQEFQLQMAGTNGAAFDKAVRLLRNLTVDEPSLILDRIARVSGFGLNELSDWRVTNELTTAIPTYEAKGTRRLRSLWSCDDAAYMTSTTSAPKAILLLDNSPSPVRSLKAGTSVGVLIQGFASNTHLAFQLIQHISGREDKVIRTLREVRKTDGSCAEVQLTLLADDYVGHVHYIKVVDLNDPDGVYGLSQTFRIDGGTHATSASSEEETLESIVDNRDDNNGLS